jgi:peptide chain release factor 1
MVVQCQDERSQLQNRMRAMSILRARLYDIAVQEQQSRVTDHRIGVTAHNLPGVLDGKLDSFIDELATQEEAKRLQAIGE